jgi:hypothetical protein
MKLKKNAPAPLNSIIRRLLSFITVFILAASLFAFPVKAAYAAGAIVSVHIDIGGTPSAVTDAPLIDSTTFVPLRAFCTAMDKTSSSQLG